MKVTEFDVQAEDRDEVFGESLRFARVRPADIFRVRVEMLMTAEERDRFMELVRRDWGVSVPGAQTPQAHHAEELPTANARRRLGP